MDANPMRLANAALARMVVESIGNWLGVPRSEAAVARIVNLVMALPRFDYWVDEKNALIDAIDTGIASEGWPERITV